MTQTAGHKIAALMIVFLQLSVVSLKSFCVYIFCIPFLLTGPMLQFHSPLNAQNCFKLYIVPVV